MFSNLYPSLQIYETQQNTPTMLLPPKNEKYKVEIEDDFSNY